VFCLIAAIDAKVQSLSTSTARVVMTPGREPAKGRRALKYFGLRGFMTQPSGNPQNAPDAMLEQRIRKRAEEIRQRRERDPELFDWLLAEVEILAECHKAKSNPEAQDRIDCSLPKV
jgi:hypothetical protein